MFRKANKRPPRTPSAHQLRMRFFLGLFIFLITVAMLGFFLLLNWQQIFAH
jgi:hypothetical protein